MTDDKLHENDRALLRAAQTGEGLVELTPERLARMKAALDERDREYREDLPKLVEACPYQMRLAVAVQVFEAIVKHAEEGGSYRYLIYERLGFDTDAYVPLYIAGGMVISNEFDLTTDAPAAPEISGAQVAAAVAAWHAEYEKYGTVPGRVIDRSADEAGVSPFQGTVDECLDWIDRQCARAALEAAAKVEPEPEALGNQTPDS